MTESEKQEYKIIIPNRKVEKQLDAVPNPDYRMIEQVKGYKILKGARGKPECDIDYAAECIERLSQLVMDFPDIAELDVNPLKVFVKGSRAKIVDARILLNTPDA